MNNNLFRTCGQNYAFCGLKVDWTTGLVDSVESHFYCVWWINSKGGMPGIKVILVRQIRAHLDPGSVCVNCLYSGHILYLWLMRHTANFSTVGLWAARCISLDAQKHEKSNGGC